MLTDKQQLRIAYCGRVLSRSDNGQKVEGHYICDDWRHCERCRKFRIANERQALVLFFRQSSRPILAMTFTGSDQERLARNFTAMLRKQGYVYRRYPLIDRIVILHCNPINTHAQDLTFKEMVDSVEAWTAQPPGKNISGKLGIFPDKKKRTGELVVDLMWESNAPKEVDDALAKTAMNEAKLAYPTVTTAKEYNERTLLFERKLRLLLYKSGYDLTFSLHLREYKVLTKNLHRPEGVLSKRRQFYSRRGAYAGI